MKSKNNIYAKFQMPQVINAAGTLTSLGGCRTHPVVMEAMSAAAGEFIPLAEFHQKTGEHLARALGVEAAMVTSGAAAGLVLASSVCLLGANPKTAASTLPSRPPKNQVLIQCCHRNPFERAIQMAGAKLTQFGDAIRTRPEDLESAIEAGLAYEDGIIAIAFFLQGSMLDPSLGLTETLEIGHSYKIPVIVDAAAELPPKSNLWSLAQDGADLVIFSGSKDLRGPQSSGLMVGRHDLITSAMEQSAPYEHVIGRPLKAGKEIAAGMLAAVELYLEEDEGKRFEEWNRISSFIEAGLGVVPGLQVRSFTPDQPYIQPALIPRLSVTLDDDLPINVIDLKSALWEGEPAIATEVIRDMMILNMHTLVMEEAVVLIQKVKRILSI